MQPRDRAEEAWEGRHTLHTWAWLCLILIPWEGADRCKKAEGASAGSGCFCAPALQVGECLWGSRALSQPGENLLEEFSGGPCVSAVLGLSPLLGSEADPGALPAHPPLGLPRALFFLSLAVGRSRLPSAA